MSRGIVWQGRWMTACNEEYRLRTLCRIVSAWRRASHKSNEPMWVFDVGANLGTFTLPLLAAGVNVASFEADPNNAAQLRGSIAAQRELAAPNADLLGASYVVEGVLSESIGQEVCLGAEQATNFGSVRVLTGAGSSACAAQRVRTTTLDVTIDALRAFQNSQLTMPAVPPGRPLRIVAMKCDVQGYEAFVFGGASRLLRESAPDTIFVETTNQSLLGALSHSYGYVQRGKYKDGCDANVRLERQHFAGAS